MRWPLLVVICGCKFTPPDVQEQAIDAAPEIDAIDGMPPVEPPACLTMPEYTPGPDGRLYRQTMPLDYDTAMEECFADGAHLAVIDSMAENDFLQTFGNDRWIGFDDLTTEGTFRWVTGAPPAFERFEGAEPNNNFGREDCGTLRDDGTWNDTSCEDSHVAICECDPGFAAPPRRACRDELVFSNLEGRRYLLRQGSTFAAAEADCAGIGAHLVTIGDATENADVADLFDAPAWLGYTDAAAEGTFAWTSGAPAGFEAFPASPPNNDATNCVELLDSPDGEWRITACTAQRAYACECDPLPP
jgi:hypothetical protein